MCESFHHSWGRLGRIGAGKANVAHDLGVLSVHEVVLKVEPHFFDQHFRANRIVCDGKNGRGQAEHLADLGGHFGQGCSLSEASRPVHVQCQIFVSQPEGRVDGKACQFVHDVPRLAGAAPPAVVVVHFGHRVDDRVQIGGQVEPVYQFVVRYVHHGGELDFLNCGKPAKHSGTAYAAR